MPIVSSRAGDNGLGWYATCDCEDFQYRQLQAPMSQKQINSRWNRARDHLHVQHCQDSGHVYTCAMVGGAEQHEVIASKGQGNAGPNFYCAHCLRALASLIEEKEGVKVLAFGCPDTPVPFGRTVSVDGWMVALIKEEEEKNVDN